MSMFRRSEARVCATALLLFVLPSSAASCLDGSGGGASGAPTTTSTNGTGGMMTGGSGGQSSTSTGGATTTSGTCEDALKDCPANLAECLVWTCDPTMNCAAAQVPDGTPANLQTAGDCQKDVCTQGAPVHQDDDTDTEDDGQTCTVDTCAAGMVQHDPASVGTACTENDGKVCDGAGTCVECNVDDPDCKDAAPKTVCDPGGSHVCVLPHCSNGVPDSTETDVDCGGPDCGKCADGSSCAGSGDCASNFCDNGTCEVCLVVGDCAPSEHCDSGVCVNDLPAGSACSVVAQCLSNNCVDGYCCDSACAGACVACDLAGSVGTCTSLPSGQKDPGVCDGIWISGSSCDGAGNCKHDDGNGCASPTDCLSGFCSPDGKCCNTECDAPCKQCWVNPGVCMNESNGTPDDFPAGACSGDHLCKNGTCVKTDGTPCSNGSECNSSFCVDGVCCSSDWCASEPCTACNVPGHEGQCAVVPTGTTIPTRPCNGPWGQQVCKFGACVYVDGEPCGTDLECLSGNCYRDPCCPGALGECLP